MSALGTPGLWVIADVVFEEPEHGYVAAAKECRSALAVAPSGPCGRGAAGGVWRVSVLAYWMWEAR
ncbi:hypothetical protein E4N62_39505 [Streptomyces sp. MNU76]|uniref:hypothetical protein n=1 Tax=Streptomyces sp. MNU76 TaxID=2560026 RepID=UPI001E29E33C|nr:hypothetical protein [Streptomyces sp. MNU76]MCC9710793.1 hypothetical protein [Streptomyces sp. MNU76]